MRIAIVLSPGCHFSREAPETFETVVCGHLDGGDFGHHISVLVDRPAASPPASEKVELIEISGSRLHRARDREIADAIRSLGPDYVEVHQDISCASYLSRSFPSLPVALYRHNREAPNIGFLRGIERRIRIRNVRSVICVSEACRQSFVAACPHLGANTHTVPTGIDPQKWRGSPKKRDPLIVFAARPTEHKGFGEICEALERVLDARPDWRAVLLCRQWDSINASYENYAKLQADRLKRFGNRATVLIDQPVSVVQEHMQRAAIVIVATKRGEAFGLPALEAHMAGAALISSGVGGLQEISGEQAFMLAHVTPSAIEDGLIRLIDNPQYRTKLAELGQARASKKFASKVAAAELDSVRNKIVTDHQARKKPGAFAQAASTSVDR